MTKDEVLEALVHLQVVEGVLKRLDVDDGDARGRAEAARRALATIRAILVNEAGDARERARKS